LRVIVATKIKVGSVWVTVPDELVDGYVGLGSRQADKEATDAEMAQSSRAMTSGGVQAGENDGVPVADSKGKAKASKKRKGSK
jgi:hypothetical protein